jgi:hypothetical protein
MQIGDSITTFWGEAKILDIHPYTGRYPQWFNCVLKVTAPKTKNGWLEVAAQRRSHGSR